MESLLKARSKPHILVIDDDMVTQLLLQTSLSREGYEVSIAINAEQGIADALSIQPDVILMDANMPGMNGFIASKKLKQDPATDTIPIIMITASNDDPFIQHGLEIGIDEFIRKPFNWQLLNNRIRHLLQHRKTSNKLDMITTALDNSEEAVMITDKDRNICTVNAAFSRITGYSEKDVQGKNPRFLHSGLQDQGFYETMWNNIEESGQWSGEIWNRRKNGELFPEWLTINAIRDTEGRITHYIGTFSDVPRFKRRDSSESHVILHDTQTGAASATYP